MAGWKSLTRFASMMTSAAAALFFCFQEILKTQHSYDHQNMRILVEIMQIYNKKTLISTLRYTIQQDKLLNDLSSSSSNEAGYVIKINTSTFLR